MKFKSSIIIVISIILLISATVLAINNPEQSQSQFLDMNQIMKIQPFGTFYQVELNKFEYQKGRSGYNDNKYYYLVNSDGSVNAMFLTDNSSNLHEKIELDKDSSTEISTNFIKTLMPNFDISQYQIEFNEFEGIVSSLYYYLVDENSTQYGALVILFNEYGEISCLCSDLMPNIVNSTKNDINNLSEEQAIDLAYNAIDDWIEIQKQNKGSTLINPYDDPKSIDSEIITNDLGEEIANEPESIESIEYDTSNKSSHIINAVSLFDKGENKLCWSVNIKGIKRTINKWESNCSFGVDIDAETGEIYNIYPSR